MIKKSIGITLVLVVGLSMWCGIAKCEGKLIRKSGRYLQKLDVNCEALVAKKYTVVQVLDVDVSKIRDCKNVKALDCKDRLLRDMALDTKNLLDPAFVFSSDPRAEAKLDLAITQMNPGDTFQRFLAGEIGAGSATVMVSGELADIKTGEVLLRFSVKRGATGSWKFKNSVPGKDSGPGLINDIIDLISGEICNEIRNVLQ